MLEKHKTSGEFIPTAKFIVTYFSLYFYWDKNIDAKNKTRETNNLRRGVETRVFK